MIPQTKRVAVLVAEDSPIARRLLVLILGSDPEILVVGEAQNGVEAVALTKSLRPDVVVMDIVMPGMDGLDATREIMMSTPTPIVLVTAGFAGEVERTLTAVDAGALAILAKPSGPQDPTFATDVSRLTITVKLMADVKVLRRTRSQARDATRATKMPALAHRPVEVVAIASSTGGPSALATVLGDLSRDFPVPILVTQHIMAGFHQGLAAWLDQISPLSVRLACDGQRLQAGDVLLAPHDRHLGVTSKGVVVLRDEPALRGHRPSASMMFASVAHAFADRACGVILTGMGNDGVEGLRALRGAGGLVLAQDEGTSVIYGMPGEAVAAGVVTLSLPVERIADALLEACQSGVR